MRVFDLAFTFYPLTHSILMVGAVWSLLESVDLKRGRNFFVLLLMLMTGYEETSIVTYVWHTLGGPFGFDVGYAFGMLFLAFLIRQAKAADFEWKFFVPCMLFFFTCAGAKAPVAMVLMFVPFIFCLFWLFQKNYKKAFGYGIPIVVIFALVNFVLVGAYRIFLPAYETAGGSNFQFYHLDDIIRIDTGYRVMDLVCSSAYHIWYSHPVLIFLLIVSTIIMFFLWKENLKFDSGNKMILCALLICAVVGYVMGVLINAGGKSEMYFTMAAFVPSSLFVAVIYRCLYESIDVFSKSRFLHGIIVSCAVLLSCVGIYNFFFVGKWSLDSLIVEGINQMKGGYESGAGEYSADEAKAAEWLRISTSEDAVIATDRESVGGDSGSYYNGIFSERQQYMEAVDLLNVVDYQSPHEGTILDEAERRWNLEREAFRNDTSALETLKSEGVSYLVQNENVTPFFVPDAEMLTEVYQSGTVHVYQMR